MITPIAPLVAGLLLSSALPGGAQGTSSLPAPSVRTVSTASGSKGEVRNGKFVLFDPRTTFRLPEDTKVIVTFQWLGTTGKHHLQATWHGPGDTSSSSGFDYNAESREFGAYWQLNLPPSAPLGDWHIDAQVDGQPAGSHAFQVVGPDGAVPVPRAAAPLPLTRAELYARALANTVTVQALDANGQLLSTAAGSVIGPDAVVTAFSAIDGASKVRVRAGQAEGVEVLDVVAFDRRQNWVVLKATGLPAVQALTLVSARPAIGAQCTSASPTGDGTFVATSGEIVGTHEYPRGGARINVAFNAGDAGTGAPVLDEFGALIGVAGVAADLGPSRRLYRLGDMMGQASQVLVLPIDLIHAGGGATTLAELKARGLFMQPVTLPNQILSGGFAASVLRDGARTQPIDERDHFSRREKSITTFLTWDPKRVLKGLVTLRIVDADNKVLGETKPLKLAIRPGSLTFSSWEFGVPTVAGTYHAEIFLDADLLWREVLRCH